MNDEQRERLVTLLRDLRGHNSIRGYCRQIGFHYAAWRGWEKKECVPTSENFAKLAMLAGVTVDQLLNYLNTGEFSETPDSSYTAPLVIEWVKKMPDPERIELVRQLIS
jgi:hypothetical protein